MEGRMRMVLAPADAVCVVWLAVLSTIVYRREL